MPQFRDNFHSEEAQEIMGRARFVGRAVGNYGHFRHTCPNRFGLLHHQVSTDRYGSHIHYDSQCPLRPHGPLRRTARQRMCRQRGERPYRSAYRFARDTGRLRRHPVVGRKSLRHRFAASTRRGRLGVRPICSGRPASHVGGVRRPLPRF